MQGHSTATRQDGHRRGSTFEASAARVCGVTPARAGATFLRSSRASVGTGLAQALCCRESRQRARIVIAKNGQAVIPAKAGIHRDRHSHEGGNSTGPSFPRKRESTGEATLSQVLDPRSSRAPPSVSRAWVPCPYPVTGLGTISATLSPVTSRHFIRSASHVLPIANSAPTHLTPTIRVQLQKPGNALRERVLHRQSPPIPSPPPSEGMDVMKLDAIELRDFRGISSLSLPIDENLTVIVGDNGVGKTTILDAISLSLAGLRSLLAGQVWKTHAHASSGRKVEMLPSRSRTSWSRTNVSMVEKSGEPKAVQLELSSYAATMNLESSRHNGVGTKEAT